MSETTVPSRNNRRITARKACLRTVRYRGAGEWRPATAMDLSPYGCRLRVGEDVERGSEVAVVFEVPVEEGARNAPVELVDQRVDRRARAERRDPGFRCAQRCVSLEF